MTLRIANNRIAEQIGVHPSKVWPSRYGGQIRR
ncbi:helix-turn-helix domain-containing protein [Photorhabdus asymbiotica]